jgi:hypothetical protein
MPEPNADAARRAVETLASRAIHLGKPGLDPVYGYGLVGADLRPDTRLAGSVTASNPDRGRQRPD